MKKLCINIPSSCTREKKVYFKWLLKDAAEGRLEEVRHDSLLYICFSFRSFFFALRPEHIQKHTYWIFVPFPTIPPPPVELRNRKSEIEKNSTLGFKIVHFLFQISTQIIKIRWLKNEKLYASHLSFFSVRFLVCQWSIFSVRFTMDSEMCGWKKWHNWGIIGLRCLLLPSMLLNGICPRIARFKAPTKGEKNKTRKMAHWQLTIIDFPLSPRLLLPACCRLLCLPRCEPASARFPFSQHHINEGMRERGNKLYRYKKNSAAFVVRVLCVRYAPINIKHINNQFYCRFLPLPLFTHMALWNISRQFQIFNLYNRYARQAWMNFWAFG